MAGKTTADSAHGSGRSLARFVGMAVLLTCGIGAIGYVPTRRLVGEVAAAAIGLGSGASLVGAICGAAVLVARRGSPAREIGSVVIQAMLVRMMVTAALAAVAVVAKAAPVAPLLFWVAISYVSLLTVDTLFALRIVSGQIESPQAREEPKE